MTRVLFICHGNICRSPMAEFILKDMVTKRGLAEKFYIESAATSTEEIWGGVGNPVYPPAKKRLAEAGISCAGKRARQITKSDYQKFDYLIGMDSANMRNMQRVWASDPDGKIMKMLDIAGVNRDVADPWYTGNFDRTFDDIVMGCEAFLRMLEEEGKL